ncbi:hypothetical protein [Psychrobacillus sp. OK032]|uniref:hypothetical protein n=1 Tax=Psychrobacillus sp. OK032 TaxID=1884358 RepID=UPI0008D03AC5|nr:hypothetical protein [Psychrobacillus sp. OK032]SES17391.1 hypothetical protein SAMN05518872_10588 [Psychrobacillus sp. OK032]
MIRLIKKTSNETFYCQVWKVEKNIHILSGTLGFSGEEEEIPLRLFESSKKVMKKLATEKANQGYEYVDAESLIKLAVQYRYEEEEQFEEAEEKSLFVDDLLDEALHSTGNGEYDGSEIGDGAGITFCFVIDVEIALETIMKELSKHNVLEGAEIAFLNGEGAYVSLYPEGAVFELV